MNSWVLAAIAVVAGLAIGLIASRIVYAVIGSESRPEALRNVARPISQLVLAVGVVIGLMTALGFVQPTALEQLPRDAIAFVPKLMVAAIIIILANVLASFATAALDRVTGRMPSHIQRQANLVVKGTIVALAVLLAVSQIGIDTDIINMAVAAIFFGIAASFTLLVGLGGQGVAREVAASRALRRMLRQGDHVTLDEVSGTVQNLHPTAVEIETTSGDAVLVPSSHFVSGNVAVQRSEQTENESEPSSPSHSASADGTERVDEAVQP